MGEKMLKNKKTKLKSWNEVDDALKLLSELYIQKQELEGEQTVKINEIKQSIKNKSEVIQYQIKLLKDNIERFTEENKTEFLQKRTKKLTYGTLSYRVVKKVCFKCAEDAIKALKLLKMDFCIRTKNELDKEQILNCDETILAKAGITIKSDDKLKIEPYIEEINDN